MFAVSNGCGEVVPLTQTSSSCPNHSARSKCGLSLAGILPSTLHTLAAAALKASIVNPGRFDISGGVFTVLVCVGVRGVLFEVARVQGCLAGLYRGFQLISHLASTHSSDFLFGASSWKLFWISRKLISRVVVGSARGRSVSRCLGDVAPRVALAVH